MREQDVFILADRALQRVVEQIRPEQWALDLPASFRRRGDQPVTLREIVGYHAYDDAWVPDMLAGHTMDEAGRNKFDGDLLGEEPAARFAGIVDKACAAAASVEALDTVVHCSFGDFPAREYFWQINGFRGLRARDIALAIGVDPTLPEDLVQGLWDEISPHAEEWRAIGVFGPKVEVLDDADLVTRLVALTGRQP